MQLLTLRGGRLSSNFSLLHLQASMIESGSILALQSRLFPGGWRQVTVPGSMCHPTGSQSLVLRVHTGDSLGQVCSLASV